VFVALSIQHAMRMHHFVIFVLPRCSIFFHIQVAHKRFDFIQMILNIECVLSFSLQLLSETFLILWRIQRDIFINAYLRVIYLLFWSNFNET
jgi:hypothetical protein